MSKNVIIGILALISLGSSYYAFKEHSKLEERVKAYEQEKTELIRTVNEFQKMADLARNEAMVQRALAEAQIEELKKKK